MTPEGTRPDLKSNWSSTPEKGSRRGLFFLLWCFRRIGDTPVRLLLIPISVYYCLFARTARRSSRSYLEKVFRTSDCRRPNVLDSYRHFRTFAELIVDRIPLWTGEHDHFEVVVHGKESMEHLVEKGRGAFLVGAHLGSFDVLRVVARDAGVPVNVLMYTDNAQRITDMLEMADPESKVRVIDANASAARVAFEVRSCVDRGEFVAVLADRVHPKGRGRVAHASFLGRRAPFPEGPFLLPIVLGVPVILSIALKTGPRRYEAYLETLAEGAPVSRQDRRKVVQERLETYAARLEHYCIQAPHQWFNFYDFWGGGRR